MTKYKKVKCGYCEKKFDPIRKNHLCCCQECSKKKWAKDNLGYDKKRYQNNKEKMNKQSIEWAKNNPEKTKEIRKKYRRTHREKIKENYHNPKNKIKNKARKKAYSKIRIPNGKLCEICGINKAIERHHPDYNKPLGVMFLCSECHQNITQGKNLIDVQDKHNPRE